VEIREEEGRRGKIQEVVKKMTKKVLGATPGGQDPFSAKRRREA